MYITFALALHNVPEGLAISLAIVPKGTSIQKAAGYSILSSLPQPLLAVPAFLFVGHITRGKIGFFDIFSGKLPIDLPEISLV